MRKPRCGWLGKRGIPGFWPVSLGRAGGEAGEGRAPAAPGSGRGRHQPRLMLLLAGSLVVAKVRSELVRRA